MYIASNTYNTFYNTAYNYYIITTHACSPVKSVFSRFSDNIYFRNTIFNNIISTTNIQCHQNAGPDANK